MRMLQRILFRVLNAIQQTDMITYGVRRIILTIMGVRCGTRTNVESGVYFKTGSISLGNRSYLNRGCFLDGSGGIDIGESVHIASNCVITTVTHSVGKSHCRAGELKLLKTTIKNGSWIGAGCIILPGVTVESGCLVAAGSVLRSDTMPDSLFAGVPAAFVKYYEG